MSDRANVKKKEKLKNQTSSTHNTHMLFLIKLPLLTFRTFHMILYITKMYDEKS